MRQVSESEQQALGNEYYEEQDSGILPSNGNGGPSADQDDPERPRRRKKLRRLTYQQNLILEGYLKLSRFFFVDFNHSRFTRLSKYLVRKINEILPICGSTSLYRDICIVHIPCLFLSFVMIMLMIYL